MIVRDKKWLTVITFFCAISALIAALYIGKEKQCIGYDIAMAVFGSALLGFIMSTIEYFAERRRSMERFWLEARAALIKLRKIKYIDIDVSDDNESRKYYEKYMKSIDSYIEASQIDLVDLGNAYGNLDFIFHNNSIRKMAYFDIYDKIRKYRNLLRDESMYFNLMKEGKGNFVVCVQKVNAINQKVFSVETESADGCIRKVVYQRAFDDIDEVLESFRLKIYKNAKPDYPKKEAVFAGICRISSEEESEEQITL